MINKKLIIISAQYGANNTWDNVVEILNNKIDNNCLNIVISNNLFEDPIFGVEKQLRIIYKKDNDVYNTIIKENDRLIINNLDKRCVIIYTYYKSKSSDYNLEFYIKQELIKNNNPNCDYIVVINGHSCHLQFPSLENLTILKRDNIGYDFGGHAHALEYISNLNKSYDYYFFMNSGVIGPIIKDYSILHNPHWTHNFTNKITDNVKLVGTTIACLSKKDLGGYGPKVEGFFFMTDNIGLQLFKKEGTIFCNHADKISAIINGEYGLSKCLFKHGYTISCILSRYQNINWLDRKNWNMNNNRHPSRKSSFFGKSIDPFEVIFHKWYWNRNPLVNFNIIDKYVKSVQ